MPPRPGGVATSGPPPQRTETLSCIESPHEVSPYFRIPKRCGSNRVATRQRQTGRRRGRHHGHPSVRSSTDLSLSEIVRTQRTCSCLHGRSGQCDRWLTSRGVGTTSDCRTRGLRSCVGGRRRPSRERRVPGPGGRAATRVDSPCSASCPSCDPGVDPADAGGRALVRRRERVHSAELLRVGRVRVVTPALGSQVTHSRVVTLGWGLVRGGYEKCVASAGYEQVSINEEDRSVCSRRPRRAMSLVDALRWHA